MDDFASHRARGAASHDLAAIVLDSRRDDTRAHAPEPAPITTPRGGFDARSVLVLAFVVATLAAVIGWSMMTGRDAASPSSTRAESSKVDTKAPADASTSPTTASPMVVPPVEGIDLAPGMLAGRRTGGGEATLRLVIANQGAEPLGSTQVAQVLFLLDGEPVGERTVGGLAAGARATAELGLGYCPAGRHVAVAIVDPRGMVAEGDERDNATTRAVAFGC